jgi:hypothetical protein
MLSLAEVVADMDEIEIAEAVKAFTLMIAAQRQKLRAEPRPYKWEPSWN